MKGLPGTLPRQAATGCAYVGAWCGGEGRGGRAKAGTRFAPSRMRGDAPRHPAGARQGCMPGNAYQNAGVFGLGKVQAKGRRAEVPPALDSVARVVGRAQVLQQVAWRLQAPAPTLSPHDGRHQRGTATTADVRIARRTTGSDGRARESDTCPACFVGRRRGSSAACAPRARSLQQPCAHVSCRRAPPRPRPVAPSGSTRQHLGQGERMARGRRTNLATPHRAVAARPRTASRIAARGPARVAFPKPSRPCQPGALPVKYPRTG